MYTRHMVKTFIFVYLFMALFLIPANAIAFCGFYVSKADAELYNEVSQVVISRKDDRTILTMVNDFRGDVEDFAIVVPTPVVLKKNQVHIGSMGIVKRLDAFSAPRLVEYFDADPCRRYVEESMDRAMSMSEGASPRKSSRLGVTVEQKFTVGEYDIEILSAKESGGLETWLTTNGYNIPEGAHKALQPYIDMKMKFFVAKVNITEFKKTGFTTLRPIMMAFESKKFMLPIKLGMINAKGPQDLLIYILSSQGKVEVSNYRTVNIPTNIDLPVYVKDEFGEFYEALFQKTYEREGENVVFNEYSWNVSWCDPCASPPPTRDELRRAGVFWLNDDGGNRQLGRQGIMEEKERVFITRLHVRYTKDKFKEDLMFEEANNSQHFQGRYILRHPFQGYAACSDGDDYYSTLNKQLDLRAQNLARLTGWNIKDIRSKMDIKQYKPRPWWERVFDE